MATSHHIKYIITLILGLFLIQAQGFCIELDTSIDDEINRNYNANQLEHTLPKLPSGLEPNASKQKSTSSTTQKTTKNFSTKDEFTTTKIKRGTKFKTISTGWASDSSGVGNRVNFKTTKPVTKRYITIPAGTVIRGKIIDSHSPQITGNGGLIKLEIESITINDATHYTKGKITKANGKFIYLNNIKGKRKYLSNVATNIKKSHKFFQKAMKKTSQYASDGLTVIVSPFTFVGGTIGWLGGTILSPITAIPAKGGRISLPPETRYEIKLTEDLFIYD